MQKIAEINAATEASSYLYEKDVYDPDKDPELRETAARRKDPFLPTDLNCPIFSKTSRTESLKYNNRCF